MTPLPPHLDGPAVPPKDGRPAEQLVIFFHGIGADGHDLIGLAPYYHQILAGAHCVAPDAPFAYDMAPFGRMWFSIRDLQTTSRLDGARAVAPLVDAFIDDQLAKTGLSDDKLLLVGFSQGAMLALYVGFQRRRAPAGIVSHSGMLLDPAQFRGQTPVRPPVLLTHGAVDDVLPVACLSELDEAMARIGADYSAHRIEGLGHGLDQETVTLALRFAKRTFNTA